MFSMCKEPQGVLLSIMWWCRESWLRDCEPQCQAKLTVRTDFKASSMDDASMQMWLQLTKHRVRMHQATSNYWVSSECGRWASAGHCFSKHVYKSDTASPSPRLQFSWAELWNEKLRLRFNGTPSLWSTTWRLVRRERLKGPSKIWEPETAETRNNSGIPVMCLFEHLNNLFPGAARTTGSSSVVELGSVPTQAEGAKGIRFPKGSLIF